MSARVWTDEQRRAIEQRDGGLLLAANAGSGKTSVMVERVVRAVLDDGVPVSQVLAITFTEKAATELAQRIRAAFLERDQLAAARELETAWISTIHGFCARLLRTHPLLAGLDPRFEVLEAPAADRLFDAAFDRALDGLVADRGEPVIELIAEHGVAALRTAVRSLHGELRSRGLPAALPPAPVVPEPDSAALAAAAAALGAELRTAGAGATVGKALAALDRCTALLAAPGDPRPRDLAALRLPKGNGHALASDACDAYRAALDAFSRAVADRAALPVRALLDDLLQAVDAGYAVDKHAAGALDFSDLELSARALLASRPDLRRHYAERFRHVLVDEFQDTNPLQIELLSMLDRDRLFTVGDEFQAIYGFRHADVEVFRARRRELAQEGAVATLATNFRSRPELLAALNAAFVPLFGSAFAPLQPGLPEPSDAPPPVELLIVDNARGVWADAGIVPEGTAPPATLWRIAESRVLARRVDELLAGGRERSEIVVLVRATGDLGTYERALEERGIATYVIGGRGYWSRTEVQDLVAHLGVLCNPHDGLALYSLLASPLCGVSADALVLLAAAARRSERPPWEVLTADPELAGPAPLDALPPDDRARLRAFVPWLQAERAGAGRHALDRLIDRALTATGYDLDLLALPGGQRRLANVRKLLRLAREHEAREGRDLRGFLDEIAARTADRVAEAKEAEAPVEGESLDAVRLMTIHRAKGLEFPVVCVADLGRGVPRDGGALIRVAPDGRVGLRLPAPSGGGDAVEALGYREIGAARELTEAEEERRLFYVAMTRAEELLVLSGGLALDRAIGSGATPIDWIAPALVPDLGDRLAAGEDAGEAVHDLTGRARVRWRVVRAGTPGLAAADVAGPAEEPPAVEVPRVLGEAQPGAVPAPPEPAVAAHAPIELSFSMLEEHDACAYRFELQRLAGLPSLPDEDGAGSGPAPAVAAALRGTVAHAVLEEHDFAAGTAPGHAAVAAAAEANGLPAEAVDELVRLLGNLGGTALHARLAAEPKLRTEVPFALRLATRAGEAVVRGVLDLLAESDAGALVVDWKTNRLAGRTPEEVVEHGYAVQRLVYALALLRAGAQRVEVAHCFLEAPGELAVARYAAAELPRLEAELAERAAAALAGPWAVTPEPHRELCRGCPARGTLCSHPRELTWRDPPGSRRPAPLAR